MSQNNRNSRNHRNGRNGRNKRNGQRNQRNEDQEQNNKKVPMRYQPPRSSKDAGSVEFKHEIDGMAEKTKINVYEDGTDEQYLKMIKEFQNYLQTFEIWENENAGRIVYRNFRRCISGATKDLWDEISASDQTAVEDRTELNFGVSLDKLTRAVLGVDALDNQIEYLKETKKPEKMSVKQWINRIKNINSYLPLMALEFVPLTEKQLITEVISKNIPSAWRVQYRLAKLHLKTRIDDIISDLTLIEENRKTHQKPDNDKTNKKHLKNPCRLHNGTHEWDECRQNPKNRKEDGKNKTENNRRGNGNSNGRTREEQRRTKSDRRTTRERSRSNHSRSSDDEQEFYVIHSKREKAEEKTVPSSEILIAMPEKKGSKKFKTYLGLVDSGSSGSLVNEQLAKCADYEIKLNSKPTKWDTATGVLQTNGTVQIESFILPQFARKRYITASFHMYQKQPKDKYDFILGRDLLQEIGLDIHYSASQFVWDNIIVDMVPCGYWTKTKIELTAKTWNTNV
jgi:hypothetical protein